MVTSGRRYPPLVSPGQPARLGWRIDRTPNGWTFLSFEATARAFAFFTEAEIPPVRRRACVDLRYASGLILKYPWTARIADSRSTEAQVRLLFRPSFRYSSRLPKKLGLAAAGLIKSGPGIRWCIWSKRLTIICYGLIDPGKTAWKWSCSTMRGRRVLLQLL